MSDLRDRLRALDSLEPPDVWGEAMQREPSMPWERPTTRGHRVLAAILALTVAAAGTVVAVRALGTGGGRPASGASPGIFCGTANDPGADRSYVSLGDVEFPRSLLDRTDPQDQDLDTPQAEALRETLDQVGFEDTPRTGWRIVIDKAHTAAFAAPNGPGEWALVEVSDRRGNWAFDSGESQDRLRPTRAQRGEGLRLAWPGPIDVEQGKNPQVRMELVNDRDSTWDDYRGEYWAIAQAFRPDSDRPLLDGEFGIGGVGVEYHLAPGESAELPVAFPPDVRELPPGTYDVIGCVSELGLASPVGTLRVSPSR